MTQSRTLWLFTTAFLIPVLPGFATGEESAGKKDAPSEAQLRELISQLGSDDFATRESATKRLTEAGANAFGALDAAKQSDESEVRRRAEMIVQAIVSRAFMHMVEQGANIAPLRPRNLRSIRWKAKDISKTDLIQLSCLRALETIILDGTTITNEGLACLRPLTRVSRISLRDTQITDDGLDHLAEMKDLESIDLYGCRISDEGLAQIARFSKLRRLTASGAGITNTGMSHLAHLRRLQLLWLVNCNVSRQGFEHLEPIKKQISVLRLENIKLSDDDLRPLRGFTNLEFLFLRKTSISDAALVHLKHLPKLDLLYVWDANLTDRAVGHLKDFPALKRLYLNETNETLHGLLQLRESPSLQLVRISRRFSRDSVLEVQQRLNDGRTGPKISVAPIH